MLRYLLKRIGWSILVIWLVGSVTFVVSLKVAADPVAVIAGPHASHEDRERVRHFYGLDQPLHVQYFRYFGNILKGDLGHSFRYRRPVAELIAERFPRTLLLGVMAMAFELFVGVAVGTIAAYRRNTRLDAAIMASTFVGISTPTFLSGKLFLLAFAYYLGWFPIGGYGVGFLDHIGHAILPAVTLGLLGTAYYARLVRNELGEILTSDYVRTARAKGLDPRVVLVKHGLRNALLPVVTSLGLSFGALFAGAIVTEAIFAWPGLGRLAFESITGFDIPVIVGTVIFGSFGIVLGNLLSDLAYAALDPRIRRG